MRFCIILFCVLPLSLYSQTNPEIFLFDITINNSKIELSNPKNVSNNDGYDSQPSFYDDQTILFASTRNDQTDIAKFDITKNVLTYINASEGGEYTPLKFPKKKDISAVRLDKDGLQRLYQYNIDTGDSRELIEDLVVAYYTWFNEDIIVSAVIEGEQLNLYRTNIKTGVSKKLANNVGRSFHKIPDTELVSFISKENDKQWQIKSLNPVTGRVRLIANTISNTEDICWLNKTNILSSDGSILYKLTLRVNNNWVKFNDLTNEGILDISRLATNTEGSKLLVTGEIKIIPKINANKFDPNQPLTEEEASLIVDTHLDLYNNGQLNEFVDSFSQYVIVNNFPNEKLYEGKVKLKDTYKKIFDEHEKLNLKVLNRINLNSFVIDEELSIVNNVTTRQATIYETDRKGIKGMTFLSTSAVTENPEIIIDNQLEKYNGRNLKEFIKTFDKNVKLYNFPNTLLIDGRSALEQEYKPLFDNTPDLKAEIVDRIILGNIIIDKEKSTVNGQITYAISIYEVENGLITRVTFIQ